MMAEVEKQTQEETRLRLLEAAGETFAEKGFRAATVREICALAEANIAAVNYHFGNKENLYIAAVEHAQCCGTQKEDIVWPEGTLPATKLFSFVHGMLHRLLDPNRPAWHSQLMLREMSHPTEACERIVRSYIRPMADVLGTIVDELLEHKTHRWDRYLVAFSIVGQILYHKVHQPITQRLVGPEVFSAFSVERLAEHITRFSLSAIGVPYVSEDLRQVLDQTLPYEDSQTRSASASDDELSISIIGKGNSK